MYVDTDGILRDLPLVGNVLLHKYSMTAFPPLALRELVQDVAKLLRDKNQTISVAETAAGGILSASLLSVSGASKFYKGGLTIYTLDSRIAFAGWTQDNTREYK